VHRCGKVQAVDSENVTVSVEKQWGSTAWGDCRVAVDLGRWRATSATSNREIIGPVFK